MHSKLDKRYLMYIFYISLAVITIFLCFNIVFHLDVILGTFLGIVHNSLILLKPLIIGIVIAYLLYPITKFISIFLKKRLKLKKEPHFLSVTLTYIMVIVIFIIMIHALYTMVSGQISHNTNISSMLDSINSNMPRYNELFDYINEKIKECGLSLDTKSYLNRSTSQISKYISMFIEGIFKFSRNFVISIIIGFLGFCISLYLLKDYKYFKKKYFQLMLLFISEEKLSSVNNTLKEIDDIFSKFIRGQLLDAFIVGLLCSIGLTIVGIDFSILLGFIVGMANIIPYVGPFCSNIPVIIVGAFSSNPIVTVWGLLVLFIVHKINRFFISPKIVGRSTGHNPALVVLAVFIGGFWGGILGILLSVPALGILKLFVMKLINKKKEENLANNIKPIE